MLHRPAAVLATGSFTTEISLGDASYTSLGAADAFLARLRLIYE